MSIWKRSSSSISCSWRRRPKSAPSDDASSWNQAISSPLQGVAEHAVDGARRSLPIGNLGLELPSSLSRDGVVPRAAIVFRRAPLGANPTASQHSLQGGVERALIDVEDVVGDLAESERETPPVHRLSGEELEGQHLEGPLEHLGALVWSSVGSHAPLDGQKEKMVSM